MSVPVQCEQCQAEYVIDDKLAGKRAKCKRCGNIMAIPLPGAGGATASLKDDTDGQGSPSIEPGPWAARGKEGVPKGWKSDEVVIERDEDVTDIPLESGHAYAAPGGGSFGALVPVLILLFVAAAFFVAVMQQVNLPEQSVNHSIPIWASALLRLATFFAVVGPLTMVGLIAASRIRGFRLATPVYLRATAIAALPLTLALVWGALFAGALGNELIFLVAVLVVGGLTFQVVRTILYLEPLSGLVTTGLAIVTGLIGFGISLWLMTALMAFVPAPPERPAAPMAKRQAPRDAGGSGTGGGDPDVSEGQPPTEDPSTTESSPASELADLRASSAARMGQIASAIQEQFTQSEGAWPTKLDQLTTSGVLPAEAVNSPFGPTATSGAGGEFAYAPNPSAFATAPDIVVAYDYAELNQPSGNEGATVLFGDLSVRWVDKDTLHQMLTRSEALRTQAIARGPAPPGTNAVPAPGVPQPPGVPQTPGMPPRRVDPQPVQPKEPPAGDGLFDDGPDPAAVLVARIEAAAGPLARKVTGVALPGGLKGVIATLAPSSSFAVVRQGKAGEEVIEIWTGNPPKRKGGTATFKVNLQSAANYAVSADGLRLVRIATFPKLAARVWSAETSREGAAIDLDRAVGAKPFLLGFLGDDRFVVRWEKGMTHGLEVLDVKTGKSRRRVELPGHEATPANEAVSPDGRYFAHAVRIRGANKLVVHPLAQGQPRELPITSLDAQWSVRPAGIAFSPDGAKLSALFVHEGEGIVVSWNARTWRSLPDIIVPTPVQAIRSVGGAPGRSLDWVAGGNALLLCGTVLLNARNGELIGELGVTDVVSQSVGAGDVLRVSTAQRDAPGAMAVIELDPEQLPKPEGTPVKPRPAKAKLTK